MTLKQLILKTVALTALTSSVRGQTLHFLNVENSSLSENGISFVIFDRLKNTRKVLKPKVVQCINSEIPSLNVADYVTAYMNKTLNMIIQEVKRGNPKPKKLFLSLATKKSVTTQTLALWLKSVLSQAGIDTNQLSAHSYRGAGLSSAQAKGASIEKIVSYGDWKNAETFHSHYSAPCETSPVGKLILSHFNGSE